MTSNPSTPSAAGRLRRLPVLAVLAVLAALAVAPSVAGAATAASAASAASIVFIKGGKVWLASPDGSLQRQVTTGGGWDAPSQADHGTILASRARLTGDLP